MSSKLVNAVIFLLVLVLIPSALLLLLYKYSDKLDFAILFFFTLALLYSEKFLSRSRISRFILDFSISLY